MSDHAVHLTPSGPPETVLPEPPAELRHLLQQASAVPDPDERHARLAEIAAAHPTSSEAWARLGEAARDDTEAYAYFRVGYHRGLDALRGNGWRGSGYVRWEHPGNQGFLSALAGLARQAEAIGEDDEAERCRTFLRQLDPTWSGSS